MNYKPHLIFIAASVVLMASSILPAQASLLNGNLGLNASAGAKASAAVSVQLDTAAQAKAGAQIDARVAALNALQTRIGQMVKVSSDEKASLDANIQSSVNDMVSLKAKIEADTDNVTLKTDIQSITKGFRIYLLILPQGRITAASDRAMTIVGLMNDLSAKLQARITAAQAASQNVSVLNASLSDMNAKTADANIQAQAAISGVASLQPDNGDQTIMQSNQAALNAARAKIKIAASDLKTARQDAGSIVKALESMKATVSGSASANTSAQ